MPCNCPREICVTSFIRHQKDSHYVTSIIFRVSFSSDMNYCCVDGSQDQTLGVRKQTMLKLKFVHILQFRCTVGGRT